MTIMVTKGDERRDRPEYSLDRIRQLAKSGKVVFGSRRVELDWQNLNYSPEEIHACIANLEPGDFRQSVKYHNRRFWMDEYRLRWRSSAGHLDSLYLKLHLNRDLIIVILDSFHLNR